MKKRRDTDVPRELETSGELCLAFANTGALRLDDRNPTTVRWAKTAPPVFRHYGDLVEWSRRMGVIDDDDAERIGEIAAAKIDDAKKKSAGDPPTAVAGWLAWLVTNRSRWSGWLIDFVQNRPRRSGWLAASTSQPSCGPLPVVSKSSQPSWRPLPVLGKSPQPPGPPMPVLGN